MLAARWSEASPRYINRVSRPGRMRQMRDRIGNEGSCGGCGMSRFTRVMLFVFGLMALVPTLAHAQASITGVVRDPSGAVLPGVTVEASSDALIEKVRSVVTDGSGQYRIIDLRPGTYVVTLHVERLFVGAAGRDRVDRYLRRNDRCRYARGCARGDDHRHGREPDR